MELEQQVQPGEQILWTGTKHKAVSFFEAIFNPMLFFAGLWLLCDLAFLSSFMAADRMSDNGTRTLRIAIPFFLIHLMPVWLYLGGILTSVRRARNTRYCVTDQAVYIQSGFMDIKVERKDYSKFTEVTVGQSFWDKRAGTGDVRITLDEIYYSGKHHTAHNRTFNIENIGDYETAFRIVQQARSNALQQRAAECRPAAPAYGERPLPQNSIPQTAQFNMPQIPQPAEKAASEMPELLSAPPDDFVDPTLAAFDFQTQDTNGWDDSSAS